MNENNVTGESMVVHLFCLIQLQFICLIWTRVGILPLLSSKAADQLFVEHTLKKHCDQNRWPSVDL